jgi:hypothetical protein
MTHQAPPSLVRSAADPGRQLAQLREAMRLIERIAGLEESGERDALLDESARVSSAYDRALPIVQRRFDALAAETAGWAAAGVEALLAAGREEAPRPAAVRLAVELDKAVGELTGLLETRSAIV